MRSTLSRDCRRTREALQSCLDLREAPPASVLGHLSGCEGCRRFQTSLLRLSVDVRAAVELPASLRVKGAIPVDALAATSNSGLRSWPAWRWAVGAAAAALLIVLGTGLALRLHAAAAERAGLREATALLVRDLYSQSALEGVEYAPVSVLDDVPSLSDWLSTPPVGRGSTSPVGRGSTPPPGLPGSSDTGP